MDNHNQNDNIKNDTDKETNFVKQTIYDKIDIPLKKVDRFIIGVILILIVMFILIIFI